MGHSESQVDATSRRSSLECIEEENSTRRSPRKKSRLLSPSEEAMTTKIPVTASSKNSLEKTPEKMVSRRMPVRKEVSVVTPSSSRAKRTGGARRSLVLKNPPDSASTTVVVSEGEERSSPSPSLTSSSDEEKPKVTARRRLAFGREVSSESIVVIQPNVHKVYRAVRCLTGSIGGNGSGGAIYGELTVGSMQKMVDLMKTHTGLDSKSRFIDVGSGLGKPNLHVAQDPGVEFSYGIEMEKVRWMLGMSNLSVVLEAAKRQTNVTDEEQIGHRCIFEHADMTDADFFDPFTHVYMFDIGFPPALFLKLGEMFNRSASPYLICYHGPKLMIEEYGFDVELIVQAPTSMHGSSEGHMGYLYRRNQPNGRPVGSKTCPSGAEGLPTNVPCDPLFVKAWQRMNSGISSISDFVKTEVNEHHDAGRPKRNVNKPRLSL
mmetsp:Transcript_15582/g.28320  ORF Transcript_15582/g.28320 Transcript_15582/m.28320 type:complete len:433 (-) Transcript_15582:221-1519(-)|eukprot:CAMPEP_0198285568 /NCGR_PEP_ID=MMETSP1449-20131203/4822_1 /TAXON_ID=420275 /ORGANISM="Attheya septentrionalis, Strain CCMP2084" /LENGTH=432 /DNA_ID=CAMNT_0043983025 /DNA_START=376 /DNA_END=1674 /DNA_ORIENTATION=-